MEVIFDRIVVGVDGSPEGFAALTQARRLLAPGGQLRVVVVCQEHLAVHAGFEAARMAQQMHAEANEAAGRARDDLADAARVSVELAHGHAYDRLLDAIVSMDATLVVVGSHSHSRAAGMLLGSVASRLLHEAPVAVLVARAAADDHRFPANVVVGADGSRASEAAVRVARDVAGRLGAAPRVVVAEGGKELDTVGLLGLGPLDWDRQAPVDALLAAANDADLLVVGSRGLHGIAALGSVSERVAHRAHCSVLVVRGVAVAA